MSLPDLAEVKHIFRSISRNSECEQTLSPERLKEIASDNKCETG
ncbi:protein of unknown function [Xenorhabdus nematophila AN6/1]|nr:protein of unknown function [Xenorhabdus nematophila AN6/1]